MIIQFTPFFKPQTFTVAAKLKTLVHTEVGTQAPLHIKALNNIFSFSCFILVGFFSYI